jgi:hypothetical protein
MMNEFEKETQNQAARELASFGRGSSFSESNYRHRGNVPYLADAQTSGVRPVSAPIPCLAEMGDIGAAVDLLLRAQADYARQDAGVSRAMVDVAYNAVAVEIERYIRSRRP